MKLRKPDIGFLPTPPEAIDTLLTLANLDASDVIYDLGSGDGEILIQAAKRYGTRGVGIDIDQERVEQGRRRAKIEGMSDRIEFRHADLFESDFRDASVVVLYLLPHLNLKLQPRLLEHLKPGSRILTVDFDMGDWEPDQAIQLDIPEESTVYFWQL
jgi:ubiquinone/menaquinone biosynthesis C-methylase UbiE